MLPTTGMGAGQFLLQAVRCPLLLKQAFLGQHCPRQAGAAQVWTQALPKLQGGLLPKKLEARNCGRINLVALAKTVRKYLAGL